MLADMPIDPTVIARATDLNPKSFPIGSVVYFLRYQKGSSKKYVAYGTVIEHYTGEIAVQLYEPINITTIEGVPVKDFHTPTEWRKLPKGWSYSMQLINYGCLEVPQEMEEPIHEDDPEWIKRMIDKKILVPPRENDHAKFYTDIDPKKGWRITRDYRGVEETADSICVHYTHCYATYAEAQAELDAIRMELEKQAALSDCEWSIQQIDDKLNYYSYLYGIPDDKKTAMRERLLALDNIEDVAVRINLGKFEWKYDRNRRWNAIEV